MQNQRYIIVGAGLAGCLTAWRLQQADNAVTLIGSSKLPGASEAAGGIINPVTGRWMVKSWNFDTCIAPAKATYLELEKQFNIKLYHPLPFIRYCQSQADIKLIRRRIRNPRYANVLGEYTPAGKSQADLPNDTHGSFHIKQAAYIDLKLLLRTLRGHFAKQEVFRDAVFVHSDLQPVGTGWSYQDLTANHVIFCEGSGVRGNPWFRQLPLTPIKGEILTLECPSLQLPRTILHRGKWLLPITENRFRIGATYDESDPAISPTEKGKQELLEFARLLIAPQHTLEITQHTAGIRPCTRDFCPFVGSHPEVSGLHIINGLGSKGALLAPAMIRSFLAYLLRDEPLNQEINCARYLFQTDPM